MTSISLSLKKGDTTDTARSVSYFNLYFEIDCQWRLTKKLYEIISIFPLWTFHLCVPIFQQHLNMEYTYISLSW